MSRKGDSRKPREETGIGVRRRERTETKEMPTDGRFQSACQAGKCKNRYRREGRCSELLTPTVPRAVTLQ